MTTTMSNFIALQLLVWGANFAWGAKSLLPLSSWMCAGHPDFTAGLVDIPADLQLTHEKKALLRHLGLMQ